MTRKLMAWNILCAMLTDEASGVWTGCCRNGSESCLYFKMADTQTLRADACGSLTAWGLEPSGWPLLYSHVWQRSWDGPRVHSTWDTCVWLCTPHSMTISVERVLVPRKPDGSCMACSDLLLRVKERHLSYILLQASQLRVEELGWRCHLKGLTSVMFSTGN